MCTSKKRRNKRKQAFVVPDDIDAEVVPPAEKTKPCVCWYTVAKLTAWYINPIIYLVFTVSYFMFCPFFG
jgi:hypothetical protein